jgi:hypothetical protein
LGSYLRVRVVRRFVALSDGMLGFLQQRGNAL